jgi:hypothetical protein
LALLDASWFFFVFESLSHLLALSSMRSSSQSSAAALAATIQRKTREILDSGTQISTTGPTQSADPKESAQQRGAKTRKARELGRQVQNRAIRAVKELKLSKKFDLQARVIKLSRRGKSQRQISKDLKISREVVQRMLGPTYMGQHGRPKALSDAAKGNLMLEIKQRVQQGIRVPSAVVREAFIAASEAERTHRGLAPLPVTKSVGGAAFRREFKTTMGISYKPPKAQDIAKSEAQTVPVVKGWFNKLRNVINWLNAENAKVLPSWRCPPEDHMPGKNVFGFDESALAATGDICSTAVAHMQGQEIHVPTASSGRKITSATFYDGAGNFISNTFILSGAPTVVSRDRQRPVPLRCSNPILTPRTTTPYVNASF